MKKQLILGSLMAFAGIANAQWNNSSGVNVTPGTIGIGTSGAPAAKLEVSSSTPDDGIRITNTSNYASMLYLNATAGHNWALHSSGSSNGTGGNHFSIYDLTAGGGTNRMFISGNTGNVGFGTIVPDQKVDIRGGALQVVNTATNAYTYLGRNAAPGVNDSYLYNRITTSYHLIGSNKNGSGTLRKLGFAVGGSDFETDAKMTIETNGNVGIGTNFPTSGKLQVINTDANTFAGGYFAMNCNNFSRGIYAEATGAVTNWASTFVAGSGGSNETQNVSIIASLASSSVPNNDWVAYLIGRTYCPAGVWTSSDRKLKDNIKPLESALSKLKLLQPSTYNFKTGEYKGLNLPEGEQMGLIAQDVEKVFPSVVAEVKGISQKNEKGELVINTPDHKSVNYTSLIPVLIAGIQEQQVLIESQQSTISKQSLVNADLQQQLNEQKALINSLKASGTTGINGFNSDITGFQMSQNEPNPFTHETVVKYTLPQSVSKAFMAVYDLTGKQITTLPIEQKGSASITITSEKLSAGIYIYSIVADGRVVDSKRMIVADK